MNMKLSRPELAILAFHKIGEPPSSTPRNPWYIPPRALRRHLQYLSRNGWEVISFDTFLRALSAPECLPQRAALLTFDDGYKSLLNAASLCLGQYDYPAIAFVPTHFVGGYNDFENGTQPKEASCSWDDLRELGRRGFSIQSHGVFHRAFTKLTPEEQERDLSCSKKHIEAEIGKPVELFAYPYGQIPDDGQAASHMLKNIGYRAAFLAGGGLTTLAGLGTFSNENFYSLPRVDMYPNSDLANLLGRHRYRMHLARPGWVSKLSINSIFRWIKKYP
jgi:peptidoglycan/xylan/chitin deacetylase (PgdA/CDA1 family)